MERILVTCSVITITTLGVVWWWHKNKKSRLPTEWKAVGKVSDLHLYPLKSGRRIELQEGNCTKYGLEQITDKSVYKLRDRTLIVYQSTHMEHRTARNHPKMVLIEVSNHDNDHIALDAPNMRTLYVKIPETNNAKVITITMHSKEPTELVDCGEEAATWLSRYILDSESGLRLGYKDEKLKFRTVSNKERKYFPDIQDVDMGFLSDITTYMLMTKASMTDLNSRLENEIEFTQFRPNILVDGVDLPFVEDSWKYIKIGNDAVFENVRPCTRCVLTTVNMETGVMDPTREPLTTLKTYRQLPDEENRKAQNNSPVLGIHLGIRQLGVIRLNDTVYVG